MYRYVFYGCVSVAWEIGQRLPERPKEAHRGPYKPREGWRRPDIPREAQGRPERPMERQRGRGRRSLYNVSVTRVMAWFCFLVVSLSGCSLVGGSLWNVSVCFYGCVSVAWEIGQRLPARPNEAHRGLFHRLPAAISQAPDTHR